MPRPPIGPPGGPRGPRGRMQEVEKPLDVKTTLRRILGYFRPEIRLIAGTMAAVVVTVACSIATPKLQADAIDNITNRLAGADSASMPLYPILIAMAAVYLVSAAVSALQIRCSSILSQHIVKRMRGDLFDKIVNLPIAYLDTHSHGDIMSRMTNDIENISNVVSQSLNSLVSGVLTILATVVAMVLLCPQLAALSCVTVVLTVVASKGLSGAMRKSYRKRQSLLGSLNGTVEEMVGGYRTVTAYNRQRRICADFAETSDELMRVGIKAEILGGSMGPVMNVINNIGFVIIAAFGGYFAITGRISVGVISAFIVYAKQFGRPIDELAQVYGQIQTAIAGMERVFAVMDEPDEDRSGEATMVDAGGNIEFRDINFSYTPDKQVIHDFNLSVRAGHKVALVGATGSGKTTVVNLLIRFYNVDSGAILIDGRDIRDIDCDELRRNTAIVLQDTVLFRDTVRNNICYSNENATDEQLHEAARMSNADRMIRHLPDGYDTVLDTGGGNLSQGQRQLISIARAFLANPKILILDEATSSVDTRTEKHIQDAMVKLMAGRTSLIIAHRLSTIQDADFIVVMDGGTIVESGNHEELMALGGRYKSLYETQYAGEET